MNPAVEIPGELKPVRLFGGIHYISVSKVSAKAREERLKDRQLTRLMDPSTSQFKAQPLLAILHSFEK